MNTTHSYNLSSTFLQYRNRVDAALTSIVCMEECAKKGLPTVYMRISQCKVIFEPRSVQNIRTEEEIQTDSIHPPGFFGKYERMYIDNYGSTLMGEYTYERIYRWAVTVIEVPEFLISLYYSKKKEVNLRWDDGTLRVITR